MLLIIGALRAEMVGIADHLAAATAVACGVGPQRATAATRRYIEMLAPQALLIVGSCGALDSRMPIGMVVVASECVGARSETGLVMAADMRDALAAATMRAQLPLVMGRLLTCAVPVTGSQMRAELCRRYGAAAVDMESAAIARVALEQKLPCAAVRVVVDSADDQLCDRRDPHNSRPARSARDLRIARAALAAHTLHQISGQFIGSHLGLHFGAPSFFG